VLGVTSVRPAAAEAGADRAATTAAGSDPSAQAGRLAPAWRVALTACWAGVFLGFSAVWKASEELGIGTWWLGARSSPQPMLVRLLPFLLAIGVGLAVISNVRGAVWISLAGSALIALFALVDVSRSGGLAAIELAIAVSSALVALAALSGRYRAVPRTAADTGDITVTVADDHPAQ